VKPGGEASAIGEGVGRTPKLQSDNEVRSLLDLDFISFGGLSSNFKTDDCQSNTGNLLAAFDQANGRFIDPATGEIIADCSDRRFDYGLILKTRPAQFPERAWLMCAGFAEWGTSGSAWYLARRWDAIRKEAKDRPFAVVVRVRPGQDESAESIAFRVKPE